MAHFAELDENNKVINVIVVSNDDCLDSNGKESEEVGIAFLKELFGPERKWVQTSINTLAGKHKHASRKPLRKNYARVGGVYDPIRDAFYTERDYPSWILNEETCEWEAPTPYPDSINYYVWNEFDQEWVLGEKE